MALNPVSAAAVDQTSKNGCMSPEAYRGALTSPPFSPPSNAEQVAFQAWFEIEGVAPLTFDQTILEYTIDGGQTWVEFGRLPDPQSPNPGGAAHQPYSNNGLGVAPSFAPFSFTLPVGDGPVVQIRFRFDTGDDTYQGFRGVAIDQVSVSSTTISESFEGGLGAWTADPASGPGAPSWHIVDNPQNISVKSPEINPTLVTLPDAGALPAAPSPGSNVAWFGEDSTGTFCGPDYANVFRLPPFPPPPPPPPPPGPRTLADLPNPVQGVSVNVQQVSGNVTVGIPARLAGSGRARTSQKGVRFVPLREARQIPVGSFLNTRKGKVRLRSAQNTTGKTQTGDFSAGLFQVLQSRKKRSKGLTELRLKGSSFKRCGSSGKRSQAGAARLSRRTVRRLRAKAKGRFRTRGRYSAATVRGTTWTTTDRCNGTLTKVTRGKVAVRDFRRKKTILLRRGKSYLAKAP